MKVKIAKSLTAIIILLSVSLFFQECALFRKNKCDGCPAMKQGKKVRKSSKGSI